MVEPVSQRGPCAFCCETLSPPRSRQPPADFDARRERGLKGEHSQADESNEMGLTWYLDGPESIAVVFEVFFDPANTRIALLA